MAAASKYLPIAVVEHHLGGCGTLSTFDIAERLEAIWSDVRESALRAEITSEPQCIQRLNARIARGLQVEGGAFNDPNGWLEFVEACGEVEEGPQQVLSWHFSNLYWQQLTHLKLATCWFYLNARRLQLHLPELELRLESLGKFLSSLSASGPPIFDGQTFYLDDHADAIVCGL